MAELGRQWREEKAREETSGKENKPQEGGAGASTSSSQQPAVGMNMLQCIEIDDDDEDELGGQMAALQL